MGQESITYHKGDHYVAVAPPMIKVQCLVDYIYYIMKDHVLGFFSFTI